jgi:regulatory protein
VKIECRSVAGQRQSLAIYIDEEFVRWIDVTLFGRNPPFPDTCESLSHFESLFHALEYRLAKEYGLRSLAARSQISSMLRSKFKQKKISEQVTTQILEEFKKAGYLNDEEWVNDFVTAQIKRHIGPKNIVAKLRMKGLSQSEAERAVQSLTSQDSRLQIKQLLSTKYKSRDLSDFKEKQKVVAALMRKGFDLEQIRDVLDLRFDLEEDLSSI